MIDLYKGDYYRLCLRHMGKNDNTFLLWGKNNSGYYRSIEDCELYGIDSSSKDDPLVHKDIVEKYKQKIVLPQYGDKKELYADRNSFYVLPNTGQVRKAIGITRLDIQLDGNRDSFNAYFKDEAIEEFKWEYSKTHFRVRAKETVSDFWYMDGEFEAENRNKAIVKAFNEWLPCDYDNYLDFKKDMLCSRTRKLVLDKWHKIL